MSVLIEDMKKPKDCATCHFCHIENFRAWCCITDEDIKITDMTAVQEDCPFVETLEPCEDEVNYKAAIDSACENDAAKRLNDLIFDINPDEICKQIKSGNLKNWCVTMQTEMGMALIQLPCWAEGESE